MRKTTLGPWFPIEYSGFWDIQFKDEYGNYDVLDAEAVGDEEAKANAILAASAPELLAVLQKIVDIQNEDGCWNMTPINTLYNIAELAKEAITKATKGGQK